MILYNQGEHIIYGPKWAISESERGAITNYVVGLNQDCPREIETHSHSTYKSSLLLFFTVFTKDIHLSPLSNDFPKKHILNIIKDRKTKVFYKIFSSFLPGTQLLHKEGCLCLFLLLKFILQTSSHSFSYQRFMINYEGKVAPIQELCFS